MIQMNILCKLMKHYLETIYRKKILFFNQFLEFFICCYFNISYETQNSFSQAITIKRMLPSSVANYNPIKMHL